MKLPRSMWSKFLERFKRDKEGAVHENVTCANCETNFDGNYCPNCGQSVKDYDKPFGFVVYNFLGDFFAFDTRFFRSIWALLFKPGFLSSEYISGRRVRYAPPFRIYVFVSFVLFLLLQIYTDRGLTTVLDSDLSDGKQTRDSMLASVADSVANELVMDIDSAEFVVADSILNTIGIDLDTIANEAEIHLNGDLASFRDTRNLRQSLNKLEVILEEKLEKEEDPDERAQIKEYIRLCRSPEQATAKLLKYFSWAFFVLLPIFALILKLVYVRRKQNYLRHLIFSIHIHAFIFIIMIFVVGLYMLFDGNIEWLTSILMLSVPVYIVIAMLKYYKQTTGKTIIKFLLVSFVYNTTFVFVLVGAILYTLKII